ncbi:MAG: hypothetical protein MUQ10_08395 [Anaerolineae bacterium]|nr:hypothetical protein [Anaerolineae bacterium]
MRDYHPGRVLSSETFVSIEDGQALFEGKLWTGDAAGRLEELRQLYPAWHWEGGALGQNVLTHLDTLS